MIRKITIVSLVLILFLAVSSVSANETYSEHPDSIGVVGTVTSGVYSDVDDSTFSEDPLGLNTSLSSEGSASSGLAGSLGGSEGSASSGLAGLDDSINSIDVSSGNNEDLNEEVSKIDTIINAKSIDFLYDDPKGLNISLSDSNGEKLSNKPLSVLVDGVSNNLTTAEDGTCILNFISSAGVYNVSIFFEGDENYSPSNASANITIKKASTKLKIANVRAYLTVSNYINATLLDSNGKAIKNKELSFVLNGVTYKAKTNDNGLAKVKIPNKIGNFPLKVKFLGDENYYSSSNSSKLIMTKMKVYIKAPVVKSYMTNTTYLTINLTNVYGKALANKKLTVKLPKKTYTLTTNSKGVAKLKFYSRICDVTCTIKFKATSSYYGSSASSKVIIKKMPTYLRAPSVSINSTSYGKIIITLKDLYGKALKNKAVTVNVSSLKKVYTFKTNSSGTAVFKFNAVKSYDLVIKYAGTKYYAAKSIKTKITVKAIKVKFADVIAVSQLLRSYIDEKRALPSNISYGKNNFTITQISYLMAAAIKNINNKKYSDITLISIPKTFKSSGEIYDTVYKADYLKIAKNVVGSSYNFKNKGYLKHSIYKVPFKVYTAAFSRILTYYGSNKRLPNYSLFTNSEFVKVSNSSKYTFYLTTDNIAGKKIDLNMLKSLAKAIRSKGYNAVIIGIGPDIHNVAYRYGCTGKNSVLLACFGGVDVGCIEEWTGALGDLNGYSFVNNYQGAHVLGLWFTKPYGASVSLYKKVGIAWDADYGFPLSNPAKYMSSHKISYIQTGTVANACKLLKSGKMGGPKLIK